MRMSSPRFQPSSPIHGTGRRKSQFTYRQLGLLASYSTSSPLRVIAHVDLDAFYAQAEMVRLGIAEDQPLAVQQWQGLIAVNYPARSFGIGRHCTVTDAKKLCPKLIAQHVATWREGDEKWAYHDDAASHIGTHKVSLDPYRLQSRKILALIKESLPPNLQKVEKASIDEVFLDLSAHVHSILLQRFPELTNPPYDDPTEKLPLPPTTALDWQADALIDLEDAELEADDPDWDDVAILIGSEIVRDIRAHIRRALGYTCSAGIAGNKMLSKLGSGYKKPNQQTVIRNRAVQHFLSDMKFTKIRNLGGKLGDQVVSSFNTETIKDLLPVPVEQMKLRLGDDTGVWLYNTIRGIDPSEVNSRTQIKSMLSAKSFRPSINNQEQGVKWLRIFAADIFSRLVEEGVLENRRRPKTINLHHRGQGGQTRSRQSSISQGRTLDEATLFELAKNLLSQIIQEGRVWPCANLSLSVGGFEDGVTGNLGIGAFLLKGDEARESRGASREASVGLSTHERPEKKRRVDNPGIQRFFPKKGSSSGGDAEESLDEDVVDTVNPQIRTKEGSPSRTESGPERIMGDYIKVCTRCDARLDDAEALQSHLDWHFAKDLQDEERGKRTFVNSHSTVLRGQKTAAASSSSSKKPTRASASNSKLEHGQSKLKFG